MDHLEAKNIEYMKNREEILFRARNMRSMQDRNNCVYSCNKRKRDNETNVGRNYSQYLPR